MITLYRTPARVFYEPIVGVGYDIDRLNTAIFTPNDSTVCCRECGQTPDDCQCMNFNPDGGYVKLLDSITVEGEQ